MATTALTAGFHPKIVQERLGHTTVAMTLDTCSHVTDTIQSAAAEELHRVMNSIRRDGRSTEVVSPERRLSADDGRD
jgi:hypothetical protein